MLGQGYIAQSLGFADSAAVCYFRALRYGADDPEWDGRVRVYLSIGHCDIAHYVMMTEAEILPEDVLETHGRDGSRLLMSGKAAYTPGMEITCGSMGYGLRIAVGAAFGPKRKRSRRFVYNLLSDGELGEGSTREAAISGLRHKLDNLIAVVDFNNRQADGPSQGMLWVEPLDEK